MSLHELHEFETADESFTPRRLLESLGIALLLVCAMFVLASSLLLPVVPL